MGTLIILPTGQTDQKRIHHLDVVGEVVLVHVDQVVGPLVREVAKVMPKEVIQSRL